MLPGGVLFGRSFSFSLSFELCRMRFRISISSPSVWSKFTFVCGEMTAAGRSRSLLNALIMGAI